ncbi:MAG: hypothetical protein ACRET2_00575 [Steroidobacteraceae bacterium]
MKNSALRLSLHSVGNPDFGQNPNRPVSPPLSIEVETLPAAAAAVRDYIERHRLGGGNLPSVMVFEGNRVVARISYNGRVWLPPDDGWNDSDPEDWKRWRPMSDG